MAWTEAQKRYARSEKGQLARKKYELSEKGIAAKEKWKLNRLLDNTITRDIFQRKHLELQAQMNALDTRISIMEKRRDMKIDTLDEILSFSSNIYTTYKASPPSVKQHYLKFFFDKFLIQDKKIAKVIPSLLFDVLLREQKIILRSDWLRD